MTQATAQATYPPVTASAARSVQLTIRAAVMRDVTVAWRMLDPNRLSDTFPGWLRAMTIIVNSYRAQSTAAAGRFYQAARAAAIESPTPAALIAAAGQADPQWLAKAFGFSGPGMLSRDTARPNTALSTTLGTAARVTLDAGRQTVTHTIQRDPVAVGYYRVTDGQPCAFCALLASRGVVYKKHAADFKSHNDCGCFGAPAFSHDQELPEISQRAAQVYLDRGKGSALVAFRKAWAEHQAASA